MGHLAAIAGDQLKAFITTNFGVELIEVEDTEGPEGTHIGDLTMTVYTASSWPLADPRCSLCTQAKATALSGPSESPPRTAALPLFWSSRAKDPVNARDSAHLWVTNAPANWYKSHPMN
jgi:hypothetical protein